MNKLSSKAAAIVATAVLGVGLTSAAAAADRQQSRHTYGMVGFTAGQTLRLNVVNTLPPGPSREDALPPGPTRVRLSLFDRAGRLLSSKRVLLSPGQADALNFRFPETGDIAGPRVEVRAQVDVVLPAGPSTPDPCHSTLEVVDEETARTSLLVSPAAIRGFNPQPDPPRPQ